MASAFTIHAVNDWRAVHGAQLRTALRVSMDVFGRDAVQAVKHAMILMAQSAAKLTTVAKKNRPVEKFGTFDFVWTYPKSGKPTRLFKWQFSKRAQGTADGLTGTWEQARRIGSSGLARRSWSWGQSRIGVRATSRPMRGVVSLFDVGARSKKHVGLILTNRLGYIEKAMPANFEAEVSAKATNKIMAQAEKRMVDAHKREIGKL